MYEYEGDYGFDDFMKNGGSKSERDIFEFVFKRHGFATGIDCDIWTLVQKTVMPL